MKRLILALLLAASPALANDPGEEIVAGLSQSSVSITADYAGAEILIYGAVKREAPPPKGGTVQVIVTVEGPEGPVSVRRKDRIWGIWQNNAAVEIDRAPSFYAVVTSGPLSRVLSETDDLRHRITIPRAIRSVGIASDADESPAFVNALQRIRTEEGKYSLREGGVQLTEQTLFRTDVGLPAALVEGDYTVRIFLTREGRVIDTIKRRIWVRKAGLERFMYQSAHDWPLLYGLASLLIAALAGWAASALFARFRP
ncbi:MULTISPECIES: TIGR02186 family protein [Gemmobacter]|jgi:uncharacterized protein (TIGR02186 family)|uniref:Uncharacterized protein (TIGR02186 family) n=2 Tax=Gemmobacter TaxID=204456 RepID=A0A2T6AYM4_9RHOB|nr:MULTISPECIES: TIGR02186 family protein [Gemmobacter]OJY35126.1 MAG: hypothetical protein BGP11_00160 [Rhodobacterales bacterium 65-51]PTX48913.1 uncharacterized protein (TIGR02186 family) [Gemmobacter caeni]TWI99086.1 uncharacterized protein (TIGR02186 family) [Gemmobacter caeni]GHC32153.1 membrane protein [Gemmobacter nanjingensis]